MPAWRRHTLFDHQAAALAALGRTESSEHAERGLVAYLRREAAAVFDNAALIACSRSWLADHGYLLLRERAIRRLVAAARRHQEQALFRTIAAVAGSNRERWLPQLLAQIEDGGISRLEWLGAVPPGKGPTRLEAQIEKISFLKDLGAGKLALSDLPLAGLKHFARRMTSRKAAALARIKDPHRTIEIACFLRLRLLQLSDASLTLADHQNRRPVARRPRARGGGPGEPAAAPPSPPRRSRGPDRDEALDAAGLRSHGRTNPMAITGRCYCGAVRPFAGPSA